MNYANFSIPYAVTAGRHHSEPVDPNRTPFQRDRDRIIYTKAFRRLSGKTQVFRAKHTDHIRDRLTHSLEVAQVARDMARMLKINEDVCEAVALAHDLGHTPFGHAGQDALNEMMQKFNSHFEHNEQSKRIVEILENPYPTFPGLNLTFEVLDGLAKHQTLYDQHTSTIRGKTVEAQIVDKADEIAYCSHDLDDGLRLKLFTVDELCELSLVKRAVEWAVSEYGSGAKTLVSRIVSFCMRSMITDLTSNTLVEIKARNIQTLEQVIAQPTDCVSFSSSFEIELKELRAFLWAHMYNNPEVAEMSSNGQKIIVKLFETYYAKPELMPENYREKIDVRDTREVVVKDYIAGMTDMFAQNEAARS